MKRSGTEAFRVPLMSDNLFHVQRPDSTGAQSKGNRP